jgi:hypothetical protein
MKQWYYSEFGQTRGPVSTAEIIRLLEKQELEPESYVTDGMDNPWKRIREFPEIMEEIQKPQDLPHVKDFPEEIFGREAPAGTGNLYFHIPVKRLVIMSILTGGFYQLYWFYRQWHFWAVKHKQAYRSFDREAGWLLFELMVLEKIETDRELNAVCKADFNGTSLFWIWVSVGMLAGWLYSIPLKGHDFPFFTSWIFGAANVLFILPAQKYINRVNAKLGNTYEKPRLGHYVALILPWLFIAFMLIQYGIQALNRYF